MQNISSFHKFILDIYIYIYIYIYILYIYYIYIYIYQILKLHDLKVTTSTQKQVTANMAGPP